MEPITLFQKKADCCGCGACVAVCPKGAIRMEPDEMGHLYPVISQEQCIGCKKCLQVCEKQERKQPLLAYAAVGQDRVLVKNSASGGVFATLAKSCIAQDGMAAGAVTDWQRKTVCHILTDMASDIPAMQGSKYVQSQAGDCYKEVKKAVIAGKKVFFCGTPCQAAAVKKLTGDPENLITADLICHGVPSEEMFNSFLRMLGKRLGGTVQDFCFRDKESPKPFTAKIQIQKGKKSRIYRLRSHNLSFYKYFLEADIYRESCYSCPYASPERISDLTLGDYWGMEKHHKEEMKGQDWSCVLVNTDKGRLFLEQCGKDLTLLPTETEWVAEANGQLRQPSKKGSRRDVLIKAYARGGYPAVERLFVKEQGGSLRFHWRMYKAIRK